MRTRRNQTTKGWMIGLALIAIALIIFFTRTSERLTPEPVEDLVQNVSVYHNDPYRFSIQYDSTIFTVNESSSSQWRANTNDGGVRLVQFTLPKSFEPNTNFSEATVTVGASGETNATENCLRAQNGETASGVTQLGNTTFFVFTQEDAGAGNFYSIKSYRVLRDDTCLAVEAIIHSVNIGAFDDADMVSAFDQGRVSRELSRVIDTFRFD